MERKRRREVSPNYDLGALAMRFRGTRDEVARREIAQDYERAVMQLINGGKWREIPALEDQLPDEWMPEAFFEYWQLR